MKVARLTIENFRGIRTADVAFNGHTLLVGANSIGKSTLCEALELALGPDRMFRRPVVDEFDFNEKKYVNPNGEPPQIRIEVTLVGLSEEAKRRFRFHLRIWSTTANTWFETEDAVTEPGEGQEWALPVLFLGQFDPAEDDFVGGTFFSHPEPVVDDLSPDGTELATLGAGRTFFSREDKRHCGFLYLRPNRTGSRALSFQRGSLLDTIVRLEAEAAGPLWEQTLERLASVDTVGDDTGLATIRSELSSRIGAFVSLSDTATPVDMHMSEMTREHLREMLRLFIGTQPGVHGVPFSRLSTGTLNLLVFALLTYIAELKGDSSVIFAMEEPEIALPPHAQRRLVNFVLERMGQAIVTSHSPYVIEKFEPSQILVLGRDDTGILTGAEVELPDLKLKKYREHRRQFAEAVLSRGVIVAEGATEASLLPMVSEIMERDDAHDSYLHLDLAGVSVFDAQNDVSVPLYAPIFAAMGKRVFGIHDKPNSPLATDLLAKTALFDEYVEIPYSGIEGLLATETGEAALRKFLADVQTRSDYPAQIPKASPHLDEPNLRDHVKKVLAARKGSFAGYAELLISHCENRSELPATLVSFLTVVNSHFAKVELAESPPAAPAATPDED